ncbi:MAG TPA: hypothetical protein VMT59_13680, partial [Gaiellaceae bacterium]|nr:hypothetical protein [Gaiellaceae bacterium]
IYVASRESVMNPGKETKVHFDIHQNVHFFGNHDELAKKVSDVITKNKDRLLAPLPETTLDLSQWVISRYANIATAAAPTVTYGGSIITS